MEKSEKFQKKGVKIGKFRYLNENCWLVKNLDYPPYKHCQYCKLKFHNCLFLHYQIVSFILILFFLTLSFLIEGEISILMIVSVFTLVIVYGYFFNKSTEKIIKANFIQSKTEKDLKELNIKLDERVKKRTRELEKAYGKLKKLDNAKSSFIATTSHQLRTPLTVTKGYISMVLDGSYGKMPKAIENPLKNIYESNERLIKLVNDLLNISKINAGKLELILEKIYLEDIIVSVIKELQIESNNKSIFLRFEKPKKGLSKLLIDETKIRQVILNIIDNAIKYTDKGGILVEIKKVGQMQEIQVKDTGEGIEREDILHLFDSFYRGKVRKKLIGVGLGLHIAKKIVKIHKGEIWVESQGKYKGSTFYIRLPIK